MKEPRKVPEIIHATKRRKRKGTLIRTLEICGGPPLGEARWGGMDQGTGEVGEGHTRWV